MRYTDRPYDDAAGDFQLLWDFLVQDYADRNGDYAWSVGRIADWKYNLATPRKYSPTFLAKSAHLWLDGAGRVVAFAINENLDEELAVFAKKCPSLVPARHRDRLPHRWRLTNSLSNDMARSSP